MNDKYTNPPCHIHGVELRYGCATCRGDEEPLAMSNGWDVDQPTAAICEAIYALAREVRELRKVVGNGGEETADAIDRLTHSLPICDGVLQVSKS